MSKLYKIKPDAAPTWQQKIEPELFRKYQDEGFDIDVIVDLSKEWDTALQNVLSDVVVIRDDA